MPLTSDHKGRPSVPTPPTWRLGLSRARHRRIAAEQLAARLRARKLEGLAVTVNPQGRCCWSPVRLRHQRRHRQKPQGHGFAVEKSAVRTGRSAEGCRRVATRHSPAHRRDCYHHAFTRWSARTDRLASTRFDQKETPFVRSLYFSRIFRVSFWSIRKITKIIPMIRDVESPASPFARRSSPC